MSTQTQTDFQIYVASLSDYNAGILHGVWVPLDEQTTVEDVQEQIQAMLKASPTGDAEEYAIHDTENLNHVGEFDDIAEILEYVAAAVESGDVDAYKAYVEYIGHDYATLEDFQDSYQGCYESEKDFAYQLADDIGFEPVTQWPASCIDWDQAARELFMGDFVFESGYVFRCN